MNFFWTERLTKDFGKVRALNGVSLAVEKEEIRAIIGPNGAGKTTFFNVITGRFRSTAGKVFFEGEEISGMKPYKIAQKGICRAFQIINIFSNLSVLDNIVVSVLNKYKKNLKLFSAPEKHKDVMEEALRILENVGLERHSRFMARTLSHGDKKKLDIGIALARSPKMLLLDEPTAGLNPEETQIIIELIKAIAKKERLTIIFTEHDMHVVFSICDRITVLHQGEVIAAGEPEEVRGNKLVIEVYLGEEF